MTPEGKVKRDVKKLLKKYNAYYYMPVPRGYGKKGVSDFLVGANGFFLSIETKSENNQPTKLQELELREVNAAGNIALVINEYNLDVLEEVLKHAASFRGREPLRLATSAAHRTPVQGADRNGT